MPEVDPTMGEPEKPPSRLEQIKYYTSLFLGALAIVCVFGFLFLVPFVLDPAISTIMHQFVTEPVHCNVSKHQEEQKDFGINVLGKIKGFLGDILLFWGVGL